MVISNSDYFILQYERQIKEYEIQFKEDERQLIKCEKQQEEVDRNP